MSWACSLGDLAEIDAEHFRTWLYPTLDHTGLESCVFVDCWPSWLLGVLKISCLKLQASLKNIYVYKYIPSLAGKKQSSYKQEMSFCTLIPGSGNSVSRFLDVYGCVEKAHFQGYMPDETLPIVGDYKERFVILFISSTFKLCFYVFYLDQHMR